MMSTWTMSPPAAMTSPTVVAEPREIAGENGGEDFQRAHGLLGILLKRQTSMSGVESPAGRGAFHRRPRASLRPKSAKLQPGIATPGEGKASNDRTGLAAGMGLRRGEPRHSSPLVLELTSAAAQDLAPAKRARHRAALAARRKGPIDSQREHPYREP